MLVWGGLVYLLALKKGVKHNTAARVTIAAAAVTTAAVLLHSMTCLCRLNIATYRKVMRCAHRRKKATQVK